MKGMKGVKTQKTTVKVLAQNNIEQNESISVYESTWFDVITSNKAAMLAQRKDSLNSQESKWLYYEFFSPLASILYSRSHSKGSNNIKNNYKALSNMDKEDILGEICCFFYSKSSFIDSYDPQKGAFSGLFLISALRHIRDRSKSFNFGGISVPRIRTDEDEAVRSFKTAAKYGSVKVVDEQGKDVDQSAVEFEAIEFNMTNKRYELKDVIIKDPKFLNLIINDFPVVFSRIILGLSSDQVFLSTKDRVAKGKVELELMFREGLLSGESHKAALDSVMSKWIQSSKEGAKESVINWNDPFSEVEGKKNILMEIGILEENADRYLKWLQQNVMDECKGSVIQ